MTQNKSKSINERFTDKKRTTNMFNERDFCFSPCPLRERKKEKRITKRKNNRYLNEIMTN